MGCALNLHEIMNDVSHRLDRVSPAIYTHRRREPLSEIQAFAQIDPLLADLCKRYGDARHERMTAEKEFGKDDGITEIALLAEDSAWCAMQTRYMELRADRAKMKWAQDVMEEERLEEEARAKAEARREALRAFDYMQMLARIQAMREKSHADLWLALFFLLSGGQSFYRNHYPSYSFNRLAA